MTTVRWKEFETVFAIHVEPNEYSIIYNLNGGNWDDMSSVVTTVSVFTDLLLPVTLYKDGFLFAGWYEDADFSCEMITEFSAGKGGNKVLYAKWSKNELVCSSCNILQALCNCETEEVSIYVIDKNADFAEIKTGLLTLTSKFTLDLSACHSFETVPENAFKDFINLKNIALPDSVTSIGSGAFYGCSGLTSITIPNGVTSIGESAFLRCSGLTSITIGSGLTSLSMTAFEGCNHLTKINVDSLEHLLNIKDAGGEWGSRYNGASFFYRWKENYKSCYS